MVKKDRWKLYLFYNGMLIKKVKINKEEAQALLEQKENAAIAAGDDEAALRAFIETEKAVLNSSSLLGSSPTFCGLLPVIHTPAIPVLSPDSDISRCINNGRDISLGLTRDKSKKLEYWAISSGLLPTSIISLVNGFW